MRFSFVLKSGAVVTMSANDGNASRMVEGIAAGRNVVDPTTGVFIRGEEVAMAAPESALVVHLPGGATISPPK
jgi:hypothetical protein